MKLRLRYKQRSGALQFVIFVAVLIALILSGVLLYAYTFVFLKEQSKATVENIQLADSGISYILQNTELMQNDTLLLDLSDKQNQSIKVNVRKWGIFEKAFVETQHRKKKFIKSAIIGSAVSSVSPTLYLQETNIPLTIVGDTKIKGNIFLPMQGVMPGFIAGETYNGKRLIYGISKRSGENLPKLEKKCLNQLYFYLNDYKPEPDYNLAHLPTKGIVHSFNDITKSIYLKKSILLENIDLIGNIVIKSDSLIVVKKSAYLKDILLIAPVVEIEDEVEGVFQVIASKRIKIGKFCRLGYPSAIALIQDETIQGFQIYDTHDNKIFIDEGSQIKGSVFYYSKGNPNNFSSQVVLEKSALIKGQVYCTGNFELKGKISGQVFTRQFIVNLYGTAYTNCIYGGIIEKDNVPELFGGILFENQKKTVMKWLY